MRKSKGISILAALTICVQLLSTTAYSYDRATGINEELLSPSTGYKVWSASSTTQVTRDQTIAKYPKASIDISAAKGEKEPAQVIITPDTAVSSYNVTTADLTKGTDIIAKSRIKVYRQYYLGVVEGANTVYYPDALIPIDKSLAANENTITANKNQGLWFTFDIPSNAMPGTYTGTFTVSIDSASVEIPVKLTVYGFAMPKESHVRTAFAIHDLDEPLTDLSYSKYYNFFLNYRITTTSLPVVSPQSLSLEKYAQKAKEYIIKPEVSGFSIPYLTQIANDSTHGNYNTVDYVNLEARIRSLCAESTDSENIIEKSYLYFATILDEPQASINWLVKEISTNIENMKTSIASDTGLFPADGSKDGVKNSLLKLRHVVTADMGYAESASDPDSGNFIGYVNTFSPSYNAYADSEYRYWKDVRLQAGNSMWWYGCVFPSTPHPTLHMNNSLVPVRELLWMQRNLDIEGLLYWSTTLYKAFNGTSYVARDVWTDPMGWPDAPGDGQLVYPGARYGSSDPLPTLRLENLRDGLEDYEYLWTLEQEINAANQKYGTQIKLNDYVSRLYNTMFADGDLSNKDGEALAKARKEVAMLIEALQSKSNALAVISDGSAINTADITVYASTGTQVYSGGQQISTTNITNGVQATFTVNLSDFNNGAGIDVINGGEKNHIDRCTGSKKVDFITFNSTNIQTITKSDYSFFDGINDVNLSLNTNSNYYKSGSSLKVDLKDLPSAPDSYRQYIRIPSSLVTKPFNKAQRVEFWVYNDKSVGERVYLSLTDNVGEKEVNYQFAAPNSWTYLTYDLDNTIYGDTINLDQVTKLELSFKNSGTQDSLLYIDRINVTRESISSFDEAANWTTNASIQATTDFSVYSSGISSFKLAGGSSSWPAIEYINDLGIVAGRKYQLSFKAKAAATGAGVFLRLDNRGAADSLYAGDLASVYESLPQTWTTFCRKFTATASTGGNTYKLRIIQDRSQTINIDDLMIEEITADTDFENSSNWSVNASVPISTDYGVLTSGKSSLKLEGGSGGWPAVQYANELDIVAGKRYRARFQAKAAASGSAIFLRLDNRGVADTSYAGDIASWYEALPQTWTTFSKEFTATECTGGNTYKIRIIQDRAQVIYVDNLLIEEIYPDTDYENSSNWTVNASIPVSTDYSIFTAGKSSLKLEGGNTGWPAVEYKNKLSFVEGRRYRLSFSVKAASSGSAIFLRLDNRGLSDTSYAGDLASLYVTAPQTWTVFSKDFTATECTGTNIYRLRIIQERAQTINIDNLTIEEITPDTPYEDSLDWSTNTNIPVSTDYSNVTSGNSSLKLEGGSGSWPAVEYLAMPQFTVGKAYRVSFKVKASSSGAAIFLRLDNRGLGDGSYTGDLASWYESAPQTWTTFTKDFTATACTGGNTYKLRIIMDRAQTINIDAFTILELTPDSSFETASNWSTNASIPLSTDYDVFSSGKSSLKLTGGNGGWPAVEYLNSLGIVIGKTYKMSFKVKAASSGAAIFLRLDNRGLGDTSYAGDLASWYVAAPQVWTTFTKEFTATSVSTYKLRIIMDRTQIIYVDDITIVPVPVTGVALDQSSMTITKGDTGTLTKTLAPANADNASVTWSSGNTPVATVSSSGVVTGVEAGTSTVRCTTADGGFVASCIVTVVDIDTTYPVISGVSEGVTYNSNNGIKYITFNKGDATLNGSTFISGEGIDKTGSFTLVVSATLTTSIHFDYVKYGDITGEGLVDVQDIVLVKQHIIKISTLEGPFFSAGDLNQNNSLSISDLLALKKIMLGI
jgi:hypothetical protein